MHWPAIGSGKARPFVSSLPSKSNKSDVVNVLKFACSLGTKVRGDTDNRIGQNFDSQDISDRRNGFIHHHLKPWEDGVFERIGTQTSISDEEQICVLFVKGYVG